MQSPVPALLFYDHSSRHRHCRRFGVGRYTLAVSDSDISEMLSNPKSDARGGSRIFIREGLRILGAPFLEGAIMGPLQTGAHHGPFDIAASSNTLQSSPTSTWASWAVRAFAGGGRGGEAQCITNVVLAPFDMLLSMGMLAFVSFCFHMSFGRLTFLQVYH